MILVPGKGSGVGSTIFLFLGRGEGEVSRSVVDVLCAPGDGGRDTGVGRSAFLFLRGGEGEGVSPDRSMTSTSPAGAVCGCVSLYRV